MMVSFWARVVASWARDQAAKVLKVRSEAERFVIDFILEDMARAKSLMKKILRASTSSIYNCYLMSDWIC